MRKFVEVAAGKRGSGVFRKDTPYGLAQHALLAGCKDETIVRSLLRAYPDLPSPKAWKILWWCRGYLRRKGLLEPRGGK